jgi:hypothetical protein
MNNCKVQCLQNNNQFCPNNTLCDDLPMSKCTRINDEIHCCCDDTTPGPTPGPINKGCLTVSLFECNDSGFRLVNKDGSFDGKEFLYPIENPLYTLEDRDSIRFNNNHLWCGI